MDREGGVFITQWLGRSTTPLPMHHSSRPGQCRLQHPRKPVSIYLRPNVTNTATLTAVSLLLILQVAQRPALIINLVNSSFSSESHHSSI